AAAYRQPEPPAERGMRLAEEQAAEVEPPFAIESAVEFAQAVEQRMEERAACLHAVDDAAMDRLPQRGHADQRGRPYVGQRAREARRVDAERIDDGGAERQRKQYPAGELESVMEREQREHDVGGLEREHPR